MSDGKRKGCCAYARKESLKMNTKQLFYALSHSKITRGKFDGVYARDTLDDIQSKPQLIICNTDPSTKKGKHWLLFYFDDDVCEFFDSLGKDLKHYGVEFEQFVYRFSKTCKYSRKRTQPPASSLCGVYCLFYAFWRCQGISMKRIVKAMNNSTTVCKLVTAAFRVCSKYPCPFLQNVRRL